LLHLGQEEGVFWWGWGGGGVFFGRKEKGRIGRPHEQKEKKGTRAAIRAERGEGRKNPLPTGAGPRTIAVRIGDHSFLALVASNTGEKEKKAVCSARGWGLSRLRQTVDDERRVAGPACRKTRRGERKGTGGGDLTRACRNRYTMKLCVTRHTSGGRKGRGDLFGGPAAWENKRAVRSLTARKERPFSRTRECSLGEGKEGSKR